MKFTNSPILTASAVFAAQAAIAQGTITGSYQFVRPSDSGSDVSGSFTFDSTAPMPPGGFTLTDFTISWLGGANFGVFSPADPRVVFSSLPTFSGGSLSGTLDAIFTSDAGFGTLRFLGNFGTATASIDGIRLTGSIPSDHIAGAIAYTPVPEPSTLNCISLGLAGLFAWHHYRRRHV
jgi:hypothetical protein